MRFSNYFLPLLKENPKEAEIVSHRLMLRAGMICQQASGIYSWLPLGKKVLNKVCAIIREEQNQVGALEICMPTIQPANLWRESNRYDSYGNEMLHIIDRKGRDMLYSPTNEEMITDIFRTYVHTYKNLPLILYQIQWKFRDEIRPRFGVMRAREFLMNDAYSFDLNHENARTVYNLMFITYLRIFTRIGLRVIPMLANTGPIGGDLSHEFITLAKNGESEVFYDRQYLDLDIPMDESIDFFNADVLDNVVKPWIQTYAATKEVHNETGKWAKIAKKDQLVGRGIEVGHIFHFGDKYSLPMKAYIMGPNGKMCAALMGSYGIGISRVIAAVIEIFHDDNGIIWPASITPFDVGIINTKIEDDMCDSIAQSCYQRLQNASIDCLLDDTKERVGVKFTRMDLIGLPFQIIIGRRYIKNSEVEVKVRKTGERLIMSLEAAINYITGGK